MLLCFCLAKNWDLLLLICEFAFKSICSNSTGSSLTYLVFGCELTLPLKYAVHAVADRPV